MAISYEPLFETIKLKGKNEYFLRKNGISSSILARLKSGSGGIDSRTIDKICVLLECQPNDIMKHTPD